MKDTHVLLLVIGGLLLARYIANDAYHYWFCKCCRPSTSSSGSRPLPLQPVMNPLFNLREICKQSLLLEDHLNHPSKRCKDCINKHFLTLEALAEEAITLDVSSEYKDILSGLPASFRKLHQQALSGSDKHGIAQRLRALRKRLVPNCVNQFRDTPI